MTNKYMQVHMHKIQLQVYIKQQEFFHCKNTACLHTCSCPNKCKLEVTDSSVQPIQHYLECHNSIALAIRTLLIHRV